MTTSLTPQPRSDGKSGGSDPATAPKAARLRVLVLYAFSRCDCRCGMCDIWRETESRALDPAAIAAELSEWRAGGLERVVLSGGESLLHPHPEALFSALAPVPITLLTSGISLARHAENIARSSVDEVILSLDGPDWLHNRIRGRADAFERLQAGVAALRVAAPDLRLSARSTVQAANLAHLRGTVAQARELGLAGISFLAVDAHSGAFNRPAEPAGGDGADLLPDEEGLAALARELSALEDAESAAFESGFIAESPEKLRRRLWAHFRAELGLAAHPPLTCNAPWVSAVVESDGRMRPCFFHEPVALWRPGAMPLLEAFAGPVAQGYRDRLRVADHPTCRRCVCNLNLADS